MLMDQVVVSPPIPGNECKIRAVTRNQALFVRQKSPFRALITSCAFFKRVHTKKLRVFRHGRWGMSMSKMRFREMLKAARWKFLVRESPCQIPGHSADFGLGRACQASGPIFRSRRGNMNPSWMYMKWLMFRVFEKYFWFLLFFFLLTRIKS